MINVNKNFNLANEVNDEFLHDLLFDEVRSLGNQIPESILQDMQDEDWL